MPSFDKNDTDRNRRISDIDCRQTKDLVTGKTGIIKKTIQIPEIDTFTSSDLQDEKFVVEPKKILEVDPSAESFARMELELSLGKYVSVWVSSYMVGYWWW